MKSHKYLYHEYDSCILYHMNHLLTSHQVLNPNVTNKAAVRVIAHINTQTMTSTNADRKLESRPL